MRKMIATAVALVAAVPASATTILQTKTITAAAPTSSTVSFLKFDATLGTLNSVTLGFTSTLSASGTADNNANQQKSATLTKGATETLVGNGFSLSNVLGAGTAQLTLGPKATAFPIGTFTDSKSTSNVLNSALAAFIGSGSLDFLFQSTSQYSVPTGPISVVMSPLLGANVSLTYDYTAAPPPPPPPAVPEPATWAMMIAGFGVAGMAMRRRVSKVAFAA